MAARVCDLTVTSRATDVARASATDRRRACPRRRRAPACRRGTITLAATAARQRRRDQSVRVQRSAARWSARTPPRRTPFVGHDLPSPTASKSVTADGRRHRRPASRTSAASSITVDNTAPTLNVTGGPNGQTFGPGTTQTWTFTAADATSGLAAVECSVVATGASASFGACSGGSASHAVTNRPDGQLHLHGSRADGGGLVTTATARDVRRSTRRRPRPPSRAALPTARSSTDTSADVRHSGPARPARTFECRVYPAALTPPAFGSCSRRRGAHRDAASLRAPTRSRCAPRTPSATPTRRRPSGPSPSPAPGDGGPDTGDRNGTTGGRARDRDRDWHGNGRDRRPARPDPTTTVRAVRPADHEPVLLQGCEDPLHPAASSRDLPKGAKVSACVQGQGVHLQEQGDLAPPARKLNVLKKLKRVAAALGSRAAAEDHSAHRRGEARHVEDPHRQGARDLVPLRADGRQARPLRLIAAARGAAAKLRRPVDEALPPARTSPRASRRCSSRASGRCPTSRRRTTGSAATSWSTSGSRRARTGAAWSTSRAGRATARPCSGARPRRSSASTPTRTRTSTRG